MAERVSAYVETFQADDPVQGLRIGPCNGPAAQPGWVAVRVRAATVNHHDVWTLRGVLSHPAEPPIVLGTDAAGVTEDGRDVVVHAVVATGDDQRLLSEGVDGTLSEVVLVPPHNLIPKPAYLSWEEAACLPTTWLTAWHMLVTSARAVPGEHVLVQGSTGGLASAAIQLGVAMGLRVSATSRTEAGIEWARELGADGVPTGERLARRADIVIDGVGGATAEHSQRSLAHAGRWVVAGVTGGTKASVDLSRVFWRQLQLHGVTMGTADELAALIRFLEVSGVRPAIGSIHDGLDGTADALRALLSGEQPGKHVVRVAT
jgi:NADPH:quinone reductase-like Zn-dependent oxidoreductase